MVKRGTPEGRVKAGCLRYLEKQGITAWNNPSGAVEVRPGQWLHFGKKGSADILGILPGGRLSGDQRQFLADIEARGGLAVVVRGWRELDQALREEGYISMGPLFAENKNNQLGGTYEKQSPLGEKEAGGEK